MTHKWSAAEQENHWTDVVVSNVAAMHSKNAAGVYLTAANLIVKLTDNILEHPTEHKYREIRLRNATIRDKVLKCSNAEDALIGMGWVKRVIDMEEKMFWDRAEDSFERLRLGKTELVKYITSIREKASDDPKEKERREREEVMKTIEEDKIARAAAAKKAKTAVVINPTPCSNTALPRLVTTSTPQPNEEQN